MGLFVVLYANGSPVQPLMILGEEEHGCWPVQNLISMVAEGLLSPRRKIED